MLQSDINVVSSYKNIYNETNGFSLSLHLLAGLMDGAFNGTNNMTQCRLHTIRFSHNMTYFARAATYSRNVDLMLFYSTSFLKETYLFCYHCYYAGLEAIDVVYGRFRIDWLDIAKELPFELR